MVKKVEGAFDRTYTIHQDAASEKGWIYISKETCDNARNTLKNISHLSTEKSTVKVGGFIGDFASYILHEGVVLYQDSPPEPYDDAWNFIINSFDIQEGKNLLEKLHLPFK